MKKEDLKTDIKILVDCILCQLENPNVVERALRTLTEILINDSEGQAVLRGLGGLVFVRDLMMSPDQSPHIRGVAMYCMAHCVFGNTCNQTEVGTWDMFAFLCGLLTETAQTQKSLQPVLFLILALIANNDVGQTLLRKSNCLTRLLQLIQEFLKKQSCHSTWLEELETQTAEDLTLGKALMAVLTSCVNNPQNDENQRLCASIFPQALKVIEECKDVSITISLTSLIGQTAANNIHNQDRVKTCGGLEVLTSALHRAVNRARVDSGQLTLATTLVAAINTLISDHETNTSEFCAQGGIPLLLQLLQMEGLTDVDRLQLVLTLGHCTYNSVANQQVFVANEGLTLLIQHLPNSEDEQLSKAIRFVLKSCARTDNTNSQRKQRSSRESGFMGNEAILLKLDELERKLEENQAEFHITHKSLEDGDLTATIGRGDDAATPLMLHTVARILADNCSDSITDTSMDQRMSNIATPLMTPAIRKIKKAEASGNTQAIPQCPKPRLEEVVKESCATKTESEQLKQELEEEREEKMCLRAEVERVRAVLAERCKQEEEAGRRTELLLAELERQHTEEQAADTELEKQVAASVREYEELSRLKQEKEEELENIELKLDSIKSFAEQSGIDLTSPISQCSVSQVLGSNNSAVQSPFEIHVPLISTEKTYGKNKYGASRDINLSNSKEKSNRVQLSNQQMQLSSRNSVSEKKDNFVFVRPRTPPKSQNLRRNVTTRCSSSGRNHQRLIGASINKTPTGQGDNNNNNNCNNTLGAMTTSYHPVTPASPCLSEFDLELLQIARSGYSQGYTTPQHVKRKLVPAMASTPLLNVLGDRNNNSTRLTPSLSVKKLNNIGSVIGRYPDTPRMLKLTRKRDEYAGLENIRKNLCQTEFIENCDSNNDKSRCLRQERQVKDTTENNLHLRKDKNDTIKFGDNRSESRCLTLESDVKDVEKHSDWEESKESKEDSSSDGSSKEIPRKEIPGKAMAGQGVDTKQRPCPACNPPVLSGLLLLHSRSYNIALETNPHTCVLHREIRAAERNFILELKNLGKCTNRGLNNKRRTMRVLRCSTPQQKDVYAFPSSASHCSSHSGFISPPLSHASASDGDNRSPLLAHKVVRGVRKERVAYTKQEEFNLKHGVQHLGKFWNQILNTYDFHESRTAVDLKDKYRKMIKKDVGRSPVSMVSGGVANNNTTASTSNKKSLLPFSMAEERRLRRGVRLHGNNWVAILRHFHFLKGRTATSLRDKWRSMHR